MLGPMIYTCPLDPTSAEKMTLMAEQEVLHVIGQSGRCTFNTFHEHALFILLPRLPVPTTGFLSLQLFSPFILLWLIFFRAVNCIVAQSPFEGVPAVIAKKIARFFGRNVAVVIENHGDFEETLFLTRTVTSKSLYSWVIKKMAVFSLARADAFRAVSRTTEQQMHIWNAKGPVRIYPAWMLLDVFYRASKTTRRKEHILFAGDISYRKGVDILLRSFSLIQKQHPSLRLRVAGPQVNPDYFQEIEALARQQGIISNLDFLGRLPVTELALEMAAARVLVLPSRSEGMGRVLVESLAAGTPIVCTRVGGMPDIAREETYSRCVPAEDPQELSEGLAAFLHGYDDVAMRDVCRERAAEIFNPEDYVRVMHEINTQARRIAGAD